MESQLLTGYSGSVADRFKLPRRVYAAIRSLSVRQQWLIAIYLTGIFPGLWIVFMTQGSFNTPDEFSRYFAASNFAEHLKFTFADDVTRAAEAGSVAPRGYTLSDGAAVPNHSLGFLLLLGIVHLLVPDVLVPTALVLLSGLVFLVWATVINKLVNRSWHFTGMLLIGIAPLWYWVARPYMETAVTTLLLGVAILWMINAHKNGSPRYFKAAVALLALASLLRTPDAIFHGIIIVIFTVVFIRHTRSFRWSYSRDIYLWVAGSQVAIFILPTLILNWVTNGSPFALGYTIFLSQEYPAEHSTPSNPVTYVLSAIKTALLPNNFDLRVLRNGIFYQMVFMSPGLSVLGFVGLWMYRNEVQAVLGRAGLLLTGLAVVYLAISRSDGETFGAFQTNPDLDISLVRYWIPIYLLLAVGAALSLRKLPQSAHLSIVGLIVVQSIYMVYFTGTTPVPKLVQLTRDNASLYATALSDVVEEDAVIVVASSQDKWTALTHRTVGVWNPTPETLANVSNTVVALVQRGTSVYLLDDRPSNTRAITDYVKPLGVDSSPVKSTRTGISFIKFELAPQVLSLYKGVDSSFSTMVDTPVERFNLTVKSDGTSTNYVTNPSFELSLAGWAARGAGTVSLSNEHSAFGNRSLLMEFSNSPGGGDDNSARVNLLTQVIPAKDWYVRARVMPEVLDNAVAGIRIHVRDSSGNLLDRGYQEVARSGDSFVVLETPLRALPAGAREILIQLVVTPNGAGASARVFWDGIELLPAPANEYCDGSTNGCAWAGGPHTSISSRVSELSSIEITSSRDSLSVEGTLSAGDSLQFDDGFVTVVDSRGNAVTEPQPFEWTVDDPITVEFDTKSTPSILFTVAD